MFYVYEWFIKETGEIIYVGKGCRNRYKVKKHNRVFNEMIRRFDCDSRVIKEFEEEQEAFSFEYQRILELKKIGQCVCNINKGGTGGTTSWWNEEIRKKYSEKNVMKSIEQRNRMSKSNPMKKPETANKVAQKTRRKVVINGSEYEGVILASKIMGVSANTIISWCKRGYDTYGKPCRYADEPQAIYSDIKKTNPKIKNFKSVILDGKKYLTVSEAAKSINTHPETLIKAIKNNKKCKGHTCRYDNQQPSCGNPVEVPQKAQRLTGEDGNQ